MRWRRNRITVQPKEGWQRDRVYRVQLLPGVTDLQRNRLNQGALLTFTTGAPRPTRTFQGTVVDWTTARPAPAALVVALQMPDSLPYRGLADSSGRFDLGPLPDGEYVIKGVLDENRNNLDDPREAFDSVLGQGGTRQRAGAVGLRARHGAAAHSHGDPGGQRVRDGRVRPDARSAPAVPALRGAALAAARLERGEGRLAAAQGGG